MKREYPNHPIVGVGGVVFRGGDVLLVKRSKAPGKGEWSLPGGAVELGETLTDALKREVREEASIEIEVQGLVRVLDRILYDRGLVRFHYVIVDYLAALVSGDPSPASDVSDARFFSMNRLGRMDLHGELRETIEMARNLQ